MLSLNQHRIALTGATGFLGSHIAIALRNAGAEVYGVIRSPSKGAWLEREHTITLRSATLSDVNALIRAFAGCDTVIANAGLAIRGRASWHAFREANVVGTENVLNAAVAAGIRRVIYISTVGVYQLRSRGPICENTPLRNGFEVDLSLLTTNWRYSASKSIGEQAAWRLAAQHKLNLTVLRPGPIYGSRDHKLTRTITEYLRRRFLIVPDVRLPLVHAGDVANAVIASLINDAAFGRAYNITGPSVSLADVLSVVHQLTNSTCRLIRIPITIGQHFDNTAAHRDLSLRYRALHAGWKEALHVDQ